MARSAPFQGSSARLLANIVDGAKLLHSTAHHSVVLICAVFCGSLVIILSHFLVRLGLQASHLCCLGIVIVNVSLHLNKGIVLRAVIGSGFIVVLTHLLVGLSLQSCHLSGLGIVIVNVALDLEKDSSSELSSEVVS